jgi:hypothetical protein
MCYMRNKAHNLIELNLIFSHYFLALSDTMDKAIGGGIWSEKRKGNGARSGAPVDPHSGSHQSRA